MVGEGGALCVCERKVQGLYDSALYNKEFKGIGVGRREMG